ncbi:MAG: 5'-3' exonuclease [Porticoccaceae bacterium]
MQALLIDSSIYIFKSYFSLPEKWHAEDSQYPTQALYGFTNFLLDLLKKQQPQYVFCAFDESLKTGFRHQLCPNYKINRELPDEALAFQLNACRQLCRVLGIAEMASPQYEADDLLGAMAKQVRNAGMQPVIISRDKDLTQIIEEGDLYWDIGKSQPKNYQQLEQDLGVGCHQMADYLALVGDASDSIAGVPGVGPKTARELLSWMPSIEHIIEHSDQLGDLPIRGAAKLSDKIVNNKDQLLLSRKLATILTDIDDIPSCENIQWQGIYQDAFGLFTDEMGFGEVFNHRAADLRQRQFQHVFAN